MRKVTSILDFSAANKSWLTIYRFSDLEDSLYTGINVVSWWNGSTDGTGDIEGDHYTWFSNENNSTLNYIQYKGLVIRQNKLSEYFKNWKKPTEQEQRLFKKSLGFKLPWSEENRYYDFGDDYFEGNM